MQFALYYSSDFNELFTLRPSIQSGSHSKCKLCSQALILLHTKHPSSQLMPLLPEFPGTRSGTRTWSRRTCCRPWRSGPTSTATSPAPSTCASSTTGRATTSRTCCSPASTAGSSAAPKTSKWWVAIRRRFLNVHRRAARVFAVKGRRRRRRRYRLFERGGRVARGDLLNVSLWWCRDRVKTLWFSANVLLPAAVHYWFKSSADLRHFLFVKLALWMQVISRRFSLTCCLQVS